MTIGGIITMILSIGSVWAMLIICINRLMDNKDEDQLNS